MIAHLYDSDMPDDHLYHAPRNGLQPVAMHRKDGSSHRYLVIAQLDWGHRVDLVPAEVTWTSSDRVCIEWTSPTGARP